MSSTLQRTIIALLAAASLGTTALIALTVMRSDAAGAGAVEGQAVRVGGRGQSLFEHPLPLPPFTLTERSGEAVSRDDLAGKVWIASFIFTHCQGPCPRITSQMHQLQQTLREHPRWDGIRLVSFTVDPERDTPERLRQYADWAHADPEHWLFLTGPRAALWELIRSGFKQPVDENEADSAMPIIHSQKLVLVDGAGQVRGFYRALDETFADDVTLPNEREELLRDLDRLLAATPAAEAQP